tara:strand:- start:531 stop:932 length:402 start_codon:yes stop_codon:yes gene_type:complete
MADAVAVTTIEDGPRNAVFYLTNISDGTGEANVKKIDVSALSSLQDGTSCTGVRITKITYSNVGMGVKLTFDATTDVLAIQLPADLSDQLDYSDISGFPNYAGSGKTGDVLLTTVGHSSGDSYSIVIQCIKEY